MCELEKEEVEDIKRQSGDYITTNKIQYQPKPIDVANIGARVMRNQNGDLIAEGARDFDFLAQTGMMKKLHNS